MSSARAHDRLRTVARVEAGKDSGGLSEEKNEREDSVCVGPCAGGSGARPYCCSRKGRLNSSLSNTLKPRAPERLHAPTRRPRSRDARSRAARRPAPTSQPRCAVPRGPRPLRSAPPALPLASGVGPRPSDIREGEEGRAEPPVPHKGTRPQANHRESLDATPRLRMVSAPAPWMEGPGGPAGFEGDGEGAGGAAPSYHSSTPPALGLGI